MRVMSSKSFFESLQESLNEEIDNSPKDGTLIFDSEDEAYRDDSLDAEYQFDEDYEDVKSLISDQINDYIILNGYNKNWNESGSGYIVKEDLDGIIGNNDGIRVYKNNDGGIDLYLYDHDGYTSGTLYTFKQDYYDEAEKALQEYFDDEDFSMYYFLDWVDAGALKVLEEKGFLVPLKANGVLGESEELEPKFANRKSFYGKAHVDTLEDGTMFKYTSAKWYLPNGECIDGKGIEPDINVELSEEYKNNLTEETDNQLNEALRILSE